MIKRFLLSLLILLQSLMVFGVGSIKGVVNDAETKESIVGCNIIVQGTTLGTITDIDGNYELKDIPDGVYNVIYSFISYDKIIRKVTVKGEVVIVDIELKTVSNQIQDVVVTATKRTDTDLSLLMSSKLSMVAVNGISSQQISRSQDKDASEVIRRIPGVSIRDGKFVIVRGLTERYNSVWLNGSSTPSSESDVRAFSFDVIPSGQIDNILIYKTAAPELPADFAGAMINIKTKSLIDKNSITFSYSYGHHQGTSGLDFYLYQGGKTDWLGFDDGTRAIPQNVPATDEYSSLFEGINQEKIDKINSIGKLFNNIFTPSKKIASPDADFQLALNRRFTIGDVSIGTITAFGYNLSNSYDNAYRAAYNSIGIYKDKAYPDTAYSYLQDIYMVKTRLNALSNWAFNFGDNQKIEFRNLMNVNGASKTVLKQGFDVNRNYERSIELGYESRFTYSSQLAGFHKFNYNKTLVDWNLGYSIANKDQPDLRRIKTVVSDLEPESQYYVPLSPSKPDPNYTGRLFFNNKENILNGALNLNHKFNFDNFNPELKFGIFVENKTRVFNSRLFGYSIYPGVFPKLNNYNFNVESFNNVPAFDEAMFNSVTNQFNTKLDYYTGMHMREQSNASDNYDASNMLLATYLAFNIPVTKWFNTYLGVRVEKNRLRLNGFEFTGGNSTVPVNVDIDSVDVFPSFNSTINLTEKIVARLAAARTINRPEFREVSPFVFTSFEENATVSGNVNVRNCYINSYDTRLEWYPTQEEIVSLGVFYKDFKNPIETKIVESSNFNYSFANSESAIAYGVELDARKRLHEFEKSNSLKFLSNLTIVFNASLIRSVIQTDSLLEDVSERPLQGQSPYIINLGLYYNDSKSGLMTSLLYNKTGQRIAIVGKKDVADIYELPFNSFDFTIEKAFYKFIKVKFGIKNLLDDAVIFQRYQKYEINKEVRTQVQVTNQFKPGRQFKLGVSVSL